MENVRLKVREFVRKHIRDDNLGDSENMFDLGYVNSLFAMQLVLFVEKEFNITISRKDMDLRNFQSIASITALVCQEKGMT
jgi:methoxymalonate biosynthesis acyl carrier protein